MWGIGANNALLTSTLHRCEKQWSSSTVAGQKECEDNYGENDYNYGQNYHVLFTVDKLMNMIIMNILMTMTMIKILMIFLADHYTM